MTRRRTLRRAMGIAAMAMLLASAAACHSTRHAANGPRPARGEPTHDTMAPQPAEPATPREHTVIMFNATVEGTTVSGQLRMAADSIIWINVTKIIELGRAMATPDSVWVNVPMVNKRFAGDYRDVEHYSKQPVSFAMLQAIATADDAEAQIERLARIMGLDAKVQITRRQKVRRTTFPFNKQ